MTRALINRRLPQYAFASVLVLMGLSASLLNGHVAAADGNGSRRTFDMISVQKGEELFGRSCQQCHNSRGKGGKGPQLVRGAWGPGGANSDEYMKKVITEGRDETQMGAFGGFLTEQEIDQIIAFLRNESTRVEKQTTSEAEEDLLW